MAPPVTLRRKECLGVRATLAPNQDQTVRSWPRIARNEHVVDHHRHGLFTPIWENVLLAPRIAKVGLPD